MTQILKPCPFCDGRNAGVGETEDHLGRLWPVVRCGDCKVEVVAPSDAPTEAEAIAAWNTRPSDPDELRAALVEQTLLVDRLCSAVDQAAEDIGHESIDDLLKLIGPHNERCIELLDGRTALSRNVGDVG